MTIPPNTMSMETVIRGRAGSTVTVTNSGDVAWGDFHFGIYDPIGGQFIDNVHFLDASTGGNDPTKQPSSPLTWDIDNVGRRRDDSTCTTTMTRSSRTRPPRFPSGRITLTMCRSSA